MLHSECVEIAPKYFSDFVEAINQRFDHVDERIDFIAATVKSHDEILRRLEPYVGDHENRISRLERSVTRLRLKVDG